MTRNHKKNKQPPKYDMVTPIFGRQDYYLFSHDFDEKCLDIVTRTSQPTGPRTRGPILVKL